ncbi:MAG: energy transducer TonB [Bacteroidetes bacterium MedPE-SWsnd-G2]|nr:MAG: energy transducer TonB [Bacteroidetes bacterium MedPE-SWsnd-G2]
MKYLETKHEKNSAKITGLLLVIILLLLFVVGPPYMDPPLEYGVAVNFGTSNVGSGNVQPLKPVKSEPREVVEEPQEVQEEVQETPVEESVEASEPEAAPSEEVVTQETEEGIAIKKAKEAAEAKAKEEARAKAEADRKAKEAQEAKEKKEREEAEKKKNLDALIGGVSKSEGEKTGGEGDDNSPGDKGQLDGDPYAPSYFGTPGQGNGGSGYGLSGRGRPSKNVIKQDCNEEGRVVVRIVVNREGKVIKAQPGIKGTTNNAACLMTPARKTAMSYKWPADSKAPAEQVGFIVIDFSVSQ